MLFLDGLRQLGLGIANGGCGLSKMAGGAFTWPYEAVHGSIETTSDMYPIAVRKNGSSAVVELRSPDLLRFSEALERASVDQQKVYTGAEKVTEEMWRSHPIIQVLRTIAKDKKADSPVREFAKSCLRATRKLVHLDEEDNKTSKQDKKNKKAIKLLESKREEDSKKIDEIYKKIDEDRKIRDEDRKTRDEQFKALMVGRPATTTSEAHPVPPKGDITMDRLAPEVVEGLTDSLGVVLSQVKALQEQFELFLIKEGKKKEEKKDKKEQPANAG